MVLVSWFVWIFTAAFLGKSLGVFVDAMVAYDYIKAIASNGFWTLILPATVVVQKLVRQCNSIMQVVFTYGILLFLSFVMRAKLRMTILGYVMIAKDCIVVTFIHSLWHALSMATRVEYSAIYLLTVFSSNLPTSPDSTLAAQLFTSNFQVVVDERSLCMLTVPLASKPPSQQWFTKTLMQLKLTWFYSIVLCIGKMFIPHCEVLKSVVRHCLMSLIYGRLYIYI